MSRCDKCSVRAVVFQKYSGMHLCRDHFEDDVHRKVREVLRETGIFGKGLKLAVALDGKKSSSVMLCILKGIFRKRRDIDMVAVLIDEGCSGYRPDALAHAKSIAERLSVPYITRRFKDVFGITVDDIVCNGGLKSPCFSCEQMRISLLNNTAIELGADVLAVGNSLDCEALEIMVGFLKGSADEILGLPPEIQLQKRIRIIKPLRRVPEREIGLYAAAHGLLPAISYRCPYSGEPFRLELEKNLAKFEGKHPGTKYSLLRSRERIVQLKPKSRADMQS